MKPTHHIRILNRLRGGFCAAMILGILIPQLAIANPLGPQVVSGQASFTAQGKTLSVTNSDRAIINWQDFSIGNGEITRFIQPTATSAVLNRVIGNNPSAIYGALQSNGRVYLVNTNGIFIGPNAAIDVNGLVASTLNISDNDFRAGKMNFSGGPLSGKIENQGAIRTPAGGSIYLIAPDVTNSGIINAPNGNILLAAGQQVSLVESTTPEIAVVVSAPEDQVLNLGRIIAEAGRIGIYGGLIRHRGIVSADSAVVDKTGAVHFRATKDITFDKDSVTTANGPKGGNITVQSTEGTTLVSGAVEARGSSNKGGTIHLLGTRVGLIDAAQIDASGENGGGTVLAGGDYQGKNTDIQNADRTYFGTDAVIKADAVAIGDGGKVVLWGNEAMRAYGSIFARGGANGGNGGFVETSGKYLDYRAVTDVRATRGLAGTLLLDPAEIDINTNPTSPSLVLSGSAPNFTYDDGDDSPTYLLNTELNAQLLLGNVSVNTSPGTMGIGRIYVNAPISWPNANSLTLNADNNIIISAAITGASGSLNLNASGSISQNAGGPITVNTLSTNSGSGTSLNDAANVVTNFSATNTSNNVAFKNTGASLTLGNINTGTGDFLLNSGGSITQGGGTGIIAPNLILTGGVGIGAFTLNNTSNQIGNVTGGVGSLNLRSSKPPDVGITVGVAGLDATGGSVALSSLYYVTVSGTVTASTINVDAGTNVTINQPINAAGGSVNLNAGGTITQAGAAIIQAGSLTTSSAGGTNLSVASNTVGSFSATNTGGGISLDNLGAPITLGSISNAGGGNVTIENTGNIIINGNINTSSGIVDLTSGGSISRTAGTISGSRLNMDTDGGIGTFAAPLQTAVGILDATNAGVGDIAITNTGAVNIPRLINNAAAGRIRFINSGSVTTGDGATYLVSGNGDVTIIANSPLTIGTGGVTSGGDITLTAGATGPGATTDILTLNGPLDATGSGCHRTHGQPVGG